MLSFLHTDPLASTQGEDLRAQLLAKHHAPLVCGPKTDLVIEGYPRSSNSFVSWMLDIVQAGRRPLSVGHHTHSVDNLRLAVHFDTPMAVLIRQPEDAILSYMIFGHLTVEMATDQYKAFYDGVLALPRLPQVFDFETATGDFNQIVTWINAQTGTHIPMSDDLKRDSAKAYDMARSRASDIHADRMTEQIAIPTAARETLKAQKRENVRAHLTQRPEIDALYMRVKQAN